jgi:predicted N-acetyltransferase YhbS
MTKREQSAPSSQIDSSGADRDWRLKQYSPSDREGVFQLRTAVYGEAFPEADWVWKFESSPLQPARIYLAESEGMIVGLRIFTYREVKVLNDVRLSVLAVDGMVHPDFRRRGIWSALVREGLRRLRAEGIHLALCFVGPHRHTYAGFCKLGWSDVGSIPLLAKPLRLGGFLSRYVRSQRVQSSANRFSRFLAGTHRSKRSPKVSGLSIEGIQSFDGRFDRLWEEVSRQAMVSLVRDQKYLNYRYRDRPGETYAQFAACRGEDLEGYIVVRRSLQMFDLSIGLIMDMGTTGGTDVALSLVNEAVRYLDEQEVDAIGCLMMKHSPYYGVLRRAGFLPVPARFNPRDYHPVVEADPSRFPSAVMRDRSNWYFTWGDFDVG